MADTGYVVYIDEAGDFGLNAVAPIDQRGASEWFVMSAAVVRKRNEKNVPRWLKEIRDAARNNQSIDLHFRKLSDRQKRIVCEMTAKFNIRLFVVVSNKINMRQYKNNYARNISNHRHWFYWWITRLLLERVSDFCASVNQRENTPGNTMQIEFSRRKDLRKNEFSDYLTRLSLQGDRAYLNKRTIDWSVFDFQNIHFFDHETRAGLQFADVVASSFFQAINTIPHSRWCPDYAKLLKPRVHKTINGKIFDEGFTLWPHSLAQVDLTDGQKETLRHFECPETYFTKRTARDQSSKSR